MSYTALYRKFRPQTFDTVIGQEHIIRTLKNQMITGRISHAYLFCGTRGTGKTSTAKIFARAINCISPIEGEPCNHCSLCEAVQEGRSLNVIEIDAASNNGVDNIREIREEVKYPPAHGKYKVYIIDEVHMLSTGAFNALLKTLEEPPAHVIFILATTDPQKVPVTILSRCQRFDFKRITTNEIVTTLQGYMTEESVEITQEALRYIARLSQGSMRDCLSILDQCLAFYYNETVTLPKVLDIVGAVDRRVFFDFTDVCIEHNAQRGMELIEEILLQGRDVSQFVLELIEHMRDLLVAVSIKDISAVLDDSAEQMESLMIQSKKTTPEEMIFFIHYFSSLLAELKYAANERILLEVALLKLCTPEIEKSQEGIAARLKNIEKKLETGQFMVSGGAMDETINKEQKPVQTKKIPKALPEDIKQAMELWDELKKELKGSLYGIATAVFLGYMENEFIYLVCDNSAVEELAKKHIEDVAVLLENKTAKTYQIKTITKEAYELWRQKNFGAEQKQQDNHQDDEFESLLSQYIPDAQFQ